MGKEYCLENRRYYRGCLVKSFVSISSVVIAAAVVTSLMWNGTLWPGIVNTGERVQSNMMDAYCKRVIKILHWDIEQGRLNEAIEKILMLYESEDFRKSLSTTFDLSGRKYVDDFVGKGFNRNCQLYNRPILSEDVVQRLREPGIFETRVNTEDQNLLEVYFRNDLPLIHYGRTDELRRDIEWARQEVLRFGSKKKLTEDEQFEYEQNKKRIEELTTKLDEIEDTVLPAYTIRIVNSGELINTASSSDEVINQLTRRAIPIDSLHGLVSVSVFPDNVILAPFSDDVIDPNGLYLTVFEDNMMKVIEGSSGIFKSDKTRIKKVVKLYGDQHDPYSYITSNIDIWQGMYMTSNYKDKFDVVKSLVAFGNQDGHLVIITINPAILTYWDLLGDEFNESLRANGIGLIAYADPVLNELNYFSPTTTGDVLIGRIYEQYKRDMFFNPTNITEILVYN